MALFFKKPAKRGKQRGNSLTFLLTSSVVLSLSLATTTVALGPMLPKEQQSASISRAFQDVAEQHLDVIQGYVQANANDFILATNYETDPTNARAKDDGLPDYQYFKGPSGFDAYFAAHLLNGQNIKTFTRTGSNVLRVNEKDANGVELTSKMEFLADGNYGLVRFFSNGTQGLYKNAIRASVTVRDSNTNKVYRRSRVIPLASDKCYELPTAQLTMPTFARNTRADVEPHLVSSYRISQVNGSAMLLGDIASNTTRAGTVLSSNTGRRSQYVCWLPTDIRNGINCETELQSPYGLEILGAQQDLTYANDTTNGARYYERRMMMILQHNRYLNYGKAGDNLEFYYWDGRTPPQSASSYDYNSQVPGSGYWHQTDISNIDVNDIPDPSFRPNTRPEDYSFTIFRPKSVGASWAEPYKGLLINKYKDADNKWKLRYSVGYWDDRRIDHSRGLFKRPSNLRDDHNASPEWYPLYEWPDGTGEFDYFRYFPEQRTIVATQTTSKETADNYTTPDFYNPHTPGNPGLDRRLHLWRMNQDTSGGANTWFTGGPGLMSDPITHTGYSAQMRFGMPNLSAEGDFVVVPVLTNTLLSSGNSNVSQVRLMAFNTRGIKINQNTNVRPTTAGSMVSTLKNATVIMSFTEGDGGTEASSGTSGYFNSKGRHVKMLNDILSWYSPKSKKFYWLVRTTTSSGGNINPNNVVYEWDPQTWAAGGASANGNWMSNNNSPGKLKTGTVYAGENPAKSSTSAYTGEFNSVRVIGPVAGGPSLKLWNNDQPPKIMDNPKSTVNEFYIRDSAGVFVFDYNLGYAKIGDSQYDAAALGNGYTLAIDSDTGLVYYATRENPGLNAYAPWSKTHFKPSTQTNSDFSAGGEPGDGNMLFINGTHSLYYLNTVAGMTSVPSFSSFHLTCSAMPTSSIAASAVYNLETDNGLLYKPSFNASGGGNRVSSQTSTVPYSAPYTSEIFERH